MTTGLRPVSRLCRRPTRRGFTLVELLAVIAILAMLFGIMLPGLNRAREKTKAFQCQNHLRELYLAHVSYINDYDFFPKMNKDEDEGAWAYNYLIFDDEGEDNPGGDFEQNFGPLVDGDGIIEDMSILYCPIQTDPWHSFATKENPWPVNPVLDTNAGYARRYHLSGRSFSQIKRTSAFLADIFHYPKVIRSAHKTGVNVAYSDGHIGWVKNKILIDNDLTRVFDASIDNKIIDEIWDVLDDDAQ